MKTRPITIVFGLVILADLVVSTSAFARPRRSAALRPNSVTASHIRNGAVVGPKIAPYAVSTSNIAGGAVTIDKIAYGAVSFHQIDPSVALWFTDANSAVWLGDNVGIGRPDPAAKLHVRGSAIFEGAAQGEANALIVNDRAGAQCLIGIAGGVGDFSSFAQDGDTVIQTTTGKNLHLQTGGGGAALTIDSNKYVGIGKANPISPLDVAGSSMFSVSYHAFLNGGGVTVASGSSDQDVAINAQTAVKAGQFLVTSDSRIKTNQHVSDSETDLATLLGIQVTDYNYIDTLQGTRPQKKVIAQQVETVYPLAVGRTTGVIPDIYQAAPIEGGWVALKADLKVGERVKLVAASGEGIHEVLEVGEGRFRTAFEPAGEKVFVYGREVDDFRSVDYEAISMLNVSATQELARQLTDQKAENEKLKQRLGDLEEELTRTRQSVTEHREVASRLEQIERAVFKK